MTAQNDRFTHMLVSLPYKGHIQTLYDPINDEVQNYLGPNMTLAEYEAHKGKKFTVLTWEELEPIALGYIDSLVTAPVEITKEEFWYALEVLPPCRWQTTKGVEMFHISERLYANLVTWTARIGKRYFQFTDYEGKCADELAQKVYAASKGRV